MKRFIFKLEPVLNYRKLKEDGEEQKLKTIQIAILEAQRHRDELLRQIDGGSQLLRETAVGLIDVDKIRTLTGYLERLRREAIRAAQIVAKLEQDRSHQLSRLLEARRNREVVEKLKDNSLSSHRKEVDALEQKLLDELSVTQYGRLTEQELPGMDSDS